MHKSQVTLISAGLILLLGGMLLWPHLKAYRKAQERLALCFDCEEYPLLCNPARVAYKAEVAADGRIELGLEFYYDGAVREASPYVMAAYQLTPAKVIAMPDFEDPEVYGVRELPAELAGSSLWLTMRPKLGAQKLPHISKYDQLNFLGPININLEDNPLCLPFIQSGAELRAYACAKTFYPYHRPQLQLGLTPLSPALVLEDCSPELIEVKAGDYPVLEHEKNLQRFANGILVDPSFPCYLLRDAGNARAEKLMLLDPSFCEWPANAPLTQLRSYYLFWNPLFTKPVTSHGHDPATP